MSARRGVASCCPTAARAKACRRRRTSARSAEEAIRPRGALAAAAAGGKSSPAVRRSRLCSAHARAAAPRRSPPWRCSLSTSCFPPPLFSSMCIYSLLQLLQARFQVACLCLELVGWSLEVWSQVWYNHRIRIEILKSQARLHYWLRIISY